MDFGNENDALEEVIDYLTSVIEKECVEGESVHITAIMTKLKVQRKE